MRQAHPGWLSLGERVAMTILSPESAEDAPYREPFPKWTRFRGYCFCGYECDDGVRAIGLTVRGGKQSPKVHRLSGHGKHRTLRDKRNGR